ncbi:MAG: carbohydrate binding domain-containing protein [Oligosphaeraceae bacterium]
MKKTFLLLLACTLCCLAQENLLVNGNFEDGTTGWVMVDGSEVARGHGFNGNGGLKVTRTPDMPYAFNRQVVELTPGQAYKLRVQVKCENVEHGKTAIGVEYNDDQGKWLGGNYQAGPDGTSDWVNLEVFTRVPKQATRGIVVLYLQKNATGTVWFDNASLAAPDAVPRLQFVYPVQGTLSLERPLVRLNAAILGNGRGEEPFRNLNVELSFTDSTGAKWSRRQPLAGHSADFLLEDAAFADGDTVNFQAQLRDVTTDAPVGEPCQLTVQARKGDAPAPAGACHIDAYGRALVDGKPYLPIGIYMSNWVDEEDRRFLCDSDFNCFLFYDSWALRLSSKEPAGDLEVIRKALDDLNRHGKKVIFSLKDFYDLPRFAAHTAKAREKFQVETTPELVELLVRAFREHPAILAWYNNDEIPLKDIQQAQERRSLLNQLDPHHPVWAVLCDFLETPFFASSCDVLGVDPYPINKDKVSHQRRTLEAMDAVREAGQPTWVVPQVFNWGIYAAVNTPERFFEWIQPRPSQMRGVILLEALRGARGFIFYSFTDLKRGYFNPERFKGRVTVQTREDYLWHWQECKELATMLKNLSPWILSRQGATPAKLQVAAGQAEAAIFRRDEDGAPAVMAASIGPENVEAELVLPEDFPPMEALYGHAREVSPGVWRFSGNDIWGEILLPRR